MVCCVKAKSKAVVNRAHLPSGTIPFTRSSLSSLSSRTQSWSSKCPLGGVSMPLDRGAAEEPTGLAPPFSRSVRVHLVVGSTNSVRRAGHISRSNTCGRWILRRRHCMWLRCLIVGAVWSSSLAGAFAGITPLHPKVPCSSHHTYVSWAVIPLTCQASRM